MADSPGTGRAGRYFRPKHVSAFRLLAPVSWDPPADPTILGSTEIVAENLLAYLDKVRQETGQKVTVTHAVARGLASLLGAHPELNCLIRRGRVWMRRDVDVFLQVAVPHADGKKLSGADLSGAIVRRADQRTTAEIAADLEAIAQKIRQHDDPMLKSTKKMLTMLPPFFSGALLRLLAYLNHDWGVDLRWMGVPDDPFGSIMVTSLGMFGVRTAYAPLFPQGRSIGVLLVGATYEKAVVENGQVVARTVLPLSIALDHRMIDGLQASVILRELTRRLEQVETLDDPTWAKPRAYHPSTGVLPAEPALPPRNRATGE